MGPIVKLIKIKEKQMNMLIASAVLKIFLAEQVDLKNALAPIAYLLLLLLLQANAAKFHLKDVAEQAVTVLEKRHVAKNVMSGPSQNDIQVIHLNALLGLVMRGG
jgi:uncharacterized membrane protein